MLLLRLKMEEEVKMIFTVFHQFLGLINLLDDDENNNLMLEIVRRRNDLLGRYLERQNIKHELFKTEFMKTEKFIIHLILVRGSPVILIGNLLMTLDYQNKDFR
jgi:hypothetical protein